ncbi:MAG: Cys-Gln thioester bond-forming surface protein [Bacilli bacterium]|nr:Cys-Gln thioester bond-forming surface protein [Bacilli bacterium]
MKKKIYRYAMVGILFFMAILGVKTVKAETYTGQAIWPSEFISNIYVKKVKPNGYAKYQQMQFIRRSEDNKFVYCLQPYTDIDNNLPYYEVARDDYAKVLNMTEEQWDRISLLSYYGYQYNENGYDHSSNKWYAITQVMIWRTTNPESDIYFTDKLNGSRINSYNDEIAEMERLVSEHYKTPSFENNLSLPLGSSMTLTDSNNVLKNYKISSTENVTATISGNTITITATGIGDAKVNLTKKTTKYETNPIVYFSNHSQNVMRVGNYDPVNTNIKLEIFGGRVEINKLDSQTHTNKPQGQGTLKGAVYGVYNTSGDLITKLTTDENGYAISDYLPSVGEFVVKEITPSNGYTLDKNSYRIIVDKDNLLASVNVLEKVISGNLEITKVYASAETQILLPEVGVKFGIYDKNDKLIKEVITDNNGKIKVSLPFGKYVLKQLTTTSGFEYADNYEFNINEDGEEIKEVIANAEITAKLKVIKIDSETKEVIKRANIKFKIFDVEENKYVCQTITYPTAKTLCEFETDENGILITPYPLYSGTYKLEEVDQVIDGYLWNKQSVEFRIDENAKLITDSKYGILFETKFENKEVKGKLIIQKTGEEIIINNGIEYSKVNLKGVKIGLYANKDIYSANGILKYKKDSLIGEYITNENGIIEINNLYLGSYYIKEISTLETHVLDNKKYEFELNYKDQYTAIINYEINLENFYKKGDLEFTKTDLITGDVIANTKIEIYTENNELVYFGTTDENGKITIKNLPVNQKFYIIETEPATGYVLTEEKVFFEIKENGEIVKANMTNKPIIGELEFTKIDFSTSEPLPNTLIEVYTENNELVFSGRTDENGIIVIKELKYGKYYILEKEAPESYVLNTEKMYFDITKDGEIVKSTMTNEKIKGKLEFTKIDFSTSEPLPNTLIEVYTENNELVFSGRTDENGMVVIEELEYGKYYILEKEAPESYLLNEEPMNFEIKENGEIVKAIMTNDKIVIEVPNTEKNKFPYLELSALILSALGMGVIIYAKKKKDK